MSNLSSLSDDQLRSLLDEVRGAGKPVETQRLRTLAQGATLGFADEIEAAVRSVIPERFGGREYEDIRNELRGKLAEYKKANPGEALTYEVAGAFLPSLGMAATGVGAPTAAATLLRTAGVGLGEGLAAGYGYSEADTLAEAVPEIAASGAAGAVFAPAGQAAMRGLTGGVSGLFNFTREKLGDKASNAVQAELMRLQGLTGKSVEEIVQDVASGRMMAENQTLQLAIKSYVTDGGVSGRTALTRMQEQAQRRQSEAMSGLREELAPGADVNILKTKEVESKALQKIENDMYESVYPLYPEVPASIADELLDLAQRFPEIIQPLNKVFRGRKVVPLFGKDDAGNVILNRTPSLQDAEIAKQILDRRAKALFTNGEPKTGIRGGPLATDTAEAAQRLRFAIDDFSPEMAAARAKAASVRRNAEQFAEGKVVLGASVNVDQLAIDFEKLPDDAKEAFKQGLMVAIIDKARRQKATIKKLADEEQQFGQILRVVLNNADIRELERKLALSGEVTEMAGKMPITAGSPTAGLQREGRRSGTAANIMSGVRAARGDLLEGLRLLFNKISDSAPQLSDAEKMQVVDVLFAENPDLVRRALTDNTAMAEVASLINQAVSTLSPGARSALVQQSGQQAGGLMAQGNF